MKQIWLIILAAFLLAMSLSPHVLAVEICYPVAVEQSEDGAEIRKTYDLAPEEDPGGIPRSDFEQNGWHYTLTDLLKQETPEYQEREYSETVTVTSKKKDMESVLALLPQEKEFVTEDGLSGTLTLQLSTVRVETAGYGSSTKTVTTTRSYPNLESQDTQYIPKSIQDGGRTMTLQDISWQTTNTANVDDFALGDRYTAVATYTGTTTSSYVTGYNVSAEYSGTVSRIALDRVRYVAIFERTTFVPEELPPEEIENPDDPGLLENPELPGEVSPPEDSAPGFHFNWAFLLIPLAVVAIGGGGLGIALFLRRRSESREETH